MSLATDEDMTMLLAAQCHMGSKNCEVFNHHYCRQILTSVGSYGTLCLETSS